MRFGQRLSSIKRKAEKLKLVNMAQASGLKPALAQANLTFILPTTPGLITANKDGPHLEDFDFQLSSPTAENQPCGLRKAKSEYKIAENRRRFHGNK